MSSSFRGKSSCKAMTNFFTPIDNYLYVICNLSQFFAVWSDTAGMKGEFYKVAGQGTFSGQNQVLLFIADVMVYCSNSNFNINFTAISHIWGMQKFEWYKKWQLSSEWTKFGLKFLYYLG